MTPIAMKVYFASDAHLGAPYIRDKRVHEQIFIDFLRFASKDADRIYLLGDMFDYWFEYRSVVPKGYVRFLGELCRLTDSGVEVHIFTGNHDAWMFSYLQRECGLQVHTHDVQTEICGRTFHIGHGDEVGWRRDCKYMILKKLFRSRIVQFCYRLLHPDLGALIAKLWSGSSRKKNNKQTWMHSFRGEEREYQLLRAREMLSEGAAIDYFVYGHRHIVHQQQLGRAQFAIIGDWVRNFTYALYDGTDFQIKRFAVSEQTIKKL